MTFYLRSWLSSGIPAAPAQTSGPQPPDSVPDSISISPPRISTATDNDDHDADQDDDGDDTETERDNNLPPAFPSLSSAQRLPSQSLAPPASQRATLDASNMPPPPHPSAQQALNNTLAPPPSFAPSSLRVPSLGPKSLLIDAEKKKRAKVALAPGHSPLDWANLKSSGADLRGVDTLLRIPPSVLKQHNKRDDAWAAFHGKVYNITPYLSFHPGGEKELMRVAGRDGTKLFSLTHAWVNVDFMLDACLVGFLVPEPHG